MTLQILLFTMFISDQEFTSPEQVVVVLMDEKTIQFYVLSAGGHVPMKVMSGSAGYDFWPSSDITLRTKDYHQSGYWS